MEQLRLNLPRIDVHVAEHFSCHVGQISFRVKTMKEIDLGYYAGLDLNERY